MSDRKRILCPDTGRLQEVELEHTSLGVVVTSCDRYPDAPLACGRACARRTDAQDREIIDDRERVLIVLANLHDDAAHIATQLIQALTADGLCVEVAEVGGSGVPPLADYDAVIVGTHVRFGHPTRSVVAYIRDHLGELTDVPAFYYSVGGRAMVRRGRDSRRLTERTGWHPEMTWAFTVDSDLQNVEIRAFARLVADAIPLTMLSSLAAHSAVVTEPGRDA